MFNMLFGAAIIFCGIVVSCLITNWVIAIIIFICSLLGGFKIAIG